MSCVLLFRWSSGMVCPPLWAASATSKFSQRWRCHKTLHVFIVVFIVKQCCFIIAPGRPCFTRKVPGCALLALCTFLFVKWKWCRFCSSNSGASRLGVDTLFSLGWDWVASRCIIYCAQWRGWKSIHIVFVVGLYKPYQIIISVLTMV